MKRILLVVLALVVVQIGINAQGITCDNNVVNQGDTVFLHVGTCGIDFGGVWVYDWDKVSGIGLPAEGCVGSQDGENPTYVYNTPGVYVVAYRAFDAGPPIDCLQPCDTLNITVLEVTAPICATYLIPEDLATDISISPTLIWDAVDDATTYEVYFGELGSMVYVDEITSTTYTPTTLDYATEYEWQIVPKNIVGTAIGCDTRSFTTEIENGISSVTTSSFSLYPNPANDYITIKAEQTIEQIIICNSIGQEILVINPNNNETTVDLSKLDSGIYSISIKIENRNNIEKLIVK